MKVKSNEESEINGQGPVITDTAIEALYQKLDKLTAGDVLARKYPEYTSGGYV